MLSFKNSSGLGTTFPCPGSSWNGSWSIFSGFRPPTSGSESPGQGNTGLPCWCSSPRSHQVASGLLPGGPGRPGGPRPCALVLLSHHLAPGAGCGQRLGSLRLGADGGWCGVSASLEGPHGCVLSKRSGLMLATCGTNFQGIRQPNQPPLGGKQDRLAPGAQYLPFGKLRGLLMVGGKANLAVLA